jgi:hypothetical protein
MKKSCLAIVLVLCCALLAGAAACDTDSTTTTAASTTTTTISTAELELRAEEWDALLASVDVTRNDRTSEIAAFLWPQDQAADRAAWYQKAHRAKPAKTDLIVKTADGEIVGITLDESGEAATVLWASDITGRDGVTTQGIQVLTWTKQGGEWYRTVSFQPLSAKAGGIQAVGSSIRVDNLTWSPTEVNELKHLVVGSGGPQTAGLFMLVSVHVVNSGDAAGTPGDYSLALYDKDGREFETSAAVDAFFYGDVASRQNALNPSMSRELYYYFEVPEGLDLSKLRYEICPTSDTSTTLPPEQSTTTSVGGSQST